jgi:hypothetical protein
MGWRNGNGYLLVGFLHDGHTAMRLGGLTWNVNSNSDCLSGYACKRG